MYSSKKLTLKGQFFAPLGVKKLKNKMIANLELHITWIPLNSLLVLLLVQPNL